MTSADNAAQGVILSNDLVRAIARRDEAEAVRLINLADDETVRWAAGRLLGMVWELALRSEGGDEAARVYLERGASDSSDITDTELRVMVQEWDERGDLDG